MSNQPRGVRNPSPLKVLRSAINQIVLVRVKDGNEYIGNLEMVDPTMNVVLSDCEETSADGRPIARYGKALIRGSHIVFVSVNYGQVAPERVAI
ncbi:LSM domain-containing protein [Thermogladius sp.]|uniref:LSM domain-containing protein n=1 Tax=Thermogladius sp. TaxID=2023064 RepID=UPI003D11F8DB